MTPEQEQDEWTIYKDWKKEPSAEQERPSTLTEHINLLPWFIKWQCRRLFGLRPIRA